MSSDQVACRHLLVKHAQSRNPKRFSGEQITRTKDEAHKIINDYLERIKNGESLEELAKAISDCSSSRKGGDLGPFGRGAMQKQFEDAAFSLKVGELSPIVDSDSGLHIIQRYT